MHFIDISYLFIYLPVVYILFSHKLNIVNLVVGNVFFSRSEFNQSKINILGGLKKDKNNSFTFKNSRYFNVW